MERNGYSTLFDPDSAGGLFVRGKHRLLFRPPLVFASLDEDEEKSTSGIEEVENGTSNGVCNYTSRRNRELASSEASNLGSVVTEELQSSEALPRHHADKQMEVPTSSTERSRKRSPSSNRANHDRGRRKNGEYYKISSKETRSRHGFDREGMTPKESSRGDEEKEHSGGYGRKRSRYDRSMKSPGRSRWDD